MAKIWEVFKAFSKVEVGNDDREVVSGLLFECGFSDSTVFSLGKERFYVQFVRQFSVYEANGSFKAALKYKPVNSVIYQTEVE